jgi:hypothetical protein
MFSLKSLFYGSKSESALLFIFVTAFVAKLIERLCFCFQVASHPLRFANNYALAEWLVNYEAGFERRGLPGSLLHDLWTRFQLPPALGVVVLSLALYAALFAFVWCKSRKIVPRWLLFTTPLLGYPVFVDRIMLRKDILIVVFTAVVIELIVRNYSRISSFLCSLLLLVLMLSHELAFFLVLPLVALSLLLRSAAIRSREGGDSLQGLSRQGALQMLFAAAPILAWLLIPVAAFGLIVLQGPTTPQATWAIASSWENAYDPAVAFPGPTGPLAWLSASTADAVLCSKQGLAVAHFGIPYPVIMVLAMASAIVLIASVLGSRSPVRAWFFVNCCLLTYLSMTPVFYSGCDHGRWGVLPLITAFLFAIQIPIAWQQRFAELTRFPSRLRDAVLPAWLAPVGLFFWGVYVVSWDPYSAPIGIILQLYFYLRILGLIPRLHALIP